MPNRISVNRHGNGSYKHQYFVELSAMEKKNEKKRDFEVKIMNNYFAQTHACIEEKK